MLRWMTLLLLSAPDAGIPRECSNVEPASEPLCNQHVLAQRGEVHWKSWAFADSPDSVFAKYRKLAERCGGQIDVKKKRVTIAGLDIAVHAAGTAGIPSCENQPEKGSQTLLLISTFTPR
ncbi:MAG: hypothetical protein ACO1OB_33010 [Archangium sp.]